eukprot:3728539-Pyramimonas_sp.AAC.1
MQYSTHAVTTRRRTTQVWREASNSTTAAPSSPGEPTHAQASLGARVLRPGPPSPEARTRGLLPLLLLPWRRRRRRVTVAVAGAVAGAAR